MEKSSTSNRRKIILLSPKAEVDMADEWYEYAMKDHFWMQWRFKKILTSPALKVVPEGRWLDIGCGHGEVIGQLEQTGNYIVDGCDLNLMALEKVGPTVGDIYVYNIFDNYPAFKNKYAAIMLLDVIEHIDDEGPFLNASIENLMPGGIVIINVPALSILFSKYDLQAGHKRRYTKQMLKALFLKYDLESMYISYWGFLLLPIAVVRKLFLVFVSKENIIRKGFSPPNPSINSFFKFLMRIEFFLFKNPPVGTSLVAIARKRLK